MHYCGGMLLIIAEHARIKGGRVQELLCLREGRKKKENEFTAFNDSANERGREREKR